MDLVTKRLSDLKPYLNNPRVNDDAVEAVAESIKQCEYIAPIIVDEDMVILAGHTRLKALESLGMTEAEVLIKSGLTDEQKRKYRILDNKTNELSEWDFDKLAEEIEGLDFGDLDIDFGVDLDEPDEVVEDDFDMEPPEEPKAKRGDVYQLGRHRLMCGDSTDADDVEKLVGGRIWMFASLRHLMAWGTLRTCENIWRRENRRGMTGHSTLIILMMLTAGEI